MEFGKFGIWTTYRAIGEDNARDAAKLVEELGYGAFWLGGSPLLPSVRPLLAGSERLTVATGIVNVWANEPATLAAEHAELAVDFPGRLLVGIGIGHPEATSDYSKPLSATRAFLDGLDAADPPLPRDDRVLAALRPKMLELARERARGAHPYFVPVEHTSAARALLGDGPLLAPEQAVVLESDPERARVIARTHTERYLRLPNYTNNLLRHGLTEADIEGAGSDALIDAVVAWGDEAAIRRRLDEHFEAGADHVCVQVITGRPGELPLDEWRRLAARFNT
jgi:probable F420-dependent oxidoreductase